MAEPLPAVLFAGRAVSFYAVVGMGLIEILEWSVGGGADQLGTDETVEPPEAARQLRPIVEGEVDHDKA